MLQSPRRQQLLLPPSPGGRGGGRPPAPPPPAAASGPLLQPPRRSLSFSGGGNGGRSSSGASSEDDDDDDEEENVRRRQLVAASLLQSQAAAAAAVPPAVQGYLLFEQTILLAQQGPGRVPYLDEERHRQRFLPPRPTDTPVTWRLKERMKVRREECGGVSIDRGRLLSTEPLYRVQLFSHSPTPLAFPPFPNPPPPKKNRR
jgi:hypothetical protein